MQFPGTILMGAQSRLLPVSVPYRFFIAASVFHVLTWVLLAAAADDIADSVGGMGLELAAVHALTLGVLVMTAIGASFQLLPVATGVSLMALWPCRLASWLYIPGVILLIAGFAYGIHHLIAVGAILVILGLIIFVVMVSGILLKSHGLRVTVLHVWASLLSLLAVMAIGFVLIADMRHGFLDDHDGVMLAHIVLAVYGFMGMLAFGYSNLLVPMFALSAAPKEKPAIALFVLSVASLLVAVGAALVVNYAVVAAAAVVASGASGWHIWNMERSLRSGMRKHHGLSFVMVRVAWAFLPVSLIVGAMAATGLLGDSGGVLFVFIALYGWLLTFLLGILQRIIPFLAAMNASKVGSKPPRLSEMAKESPLKVNSVCHFVALALVGVGIITEQGTLILIGGLSGVVGSAAFLWFAIGVLMRMRARRVATNQP